MQARPLRKAFFASFIVYLIPIVGPHARGRSAAARRIVAAGVEAQSATFLRLGGGCWVAWDAYRESEPYRVAWSLPKGAGAQHRRHPGFGVYSKGPRRRRGVAAYLPKYTRTAVAFLGDQFFAYTD